MCGVNVIEHPDTMVSMGDVGVLSRDGRSYSFDARANGYGRGEGVGSVILKSVKAALRDGDTIRAVIRATGTNSDGRGTGALSLPNKAAQEALIREVYTNAGLDMDQTGFIEAHATGTPTGDPLEAAAIAAAFQGRSAATPALYVGAGKTNIGHLEAASGVAGIIKTVLALEKGVIPPNINFEKISPRIPLDKWGLRLPLSATAWPHFPGGLRRASINSFGVGGTNAHAVLDDACGYLRHHGHAAAEADDARQDGVGSDQRYRVFLFSTHDQDGIQRVLSRYSEHLRQDREEEDQDEAVFLDRLAYTLCEKRSRLAWRLAVVAASRRELVAKLADPLTSRAAVRPGPKFTPRIGLVFTGQGAQWHAMGRELLSSCAVFRASVEAASAHVKSLACPFDVLAELTRSAAETRVDEPLVSQTLCTILQVALVDTLRWLGVVPVRVVGHSSGEIAAAYAAGALDRASAWRLAYFRGVVSANGSGRPGAMLAVGLAAQPAQAYLRQVHAELPEGELVIACYNSPTSLTCSGDAAKVDRLAELLDADGVFHRKLQVGNAYHSSHMQPLATSYRAMMGSLSGVEDDVAREPTAIFSSVTGAEIDRKDMTQADYWIQNMLRPVQFHQALLAMCRVSQPKRLGLGGHGDELPVTHVVEVGPHGALRGAVQSSFRDDASLKGIHYLSVLTRNEHAGSTMAAATGLLAASGYPVLLSRLNQSGTAPKMLTTLPAYPFNRTVQHWTESRRSQNYRFRDHGRHDILGVRTPDFNPEQPIWRNWLQPSDLPWLMDHKVAGSAVLPGVAYCVMAVEAMRELSADKGVLIKSFLLRDVVFSRALQIREEAEDAPETLFSCRKLTESSTLSSSRWWEWTLSSFSSSEQTWLEHAKGQISVEEAGATTGPVDAGRDAAEHASWSRAALQAAEEACSERVEIERTYRNLESVGIEHGPLFHNYSAMYGVPASRRIGDTLGHLSVPDVASEMPARALSDHLVHPATLDSILHMILFAYYQIPDAPPLKAPMLPVSMRSMWISAELEKTPGSKLLCHCLAQNVALKRWSADITAWSAGPGRELGIMIRGVEALSLEDPDGMDEPADEGLFCCHVAWMPDLSLMDESQTVACLWDMVQSSAAENTNTRHTPALQLAAAIYVAEAVEILDGASPGVDEEALPSHLKKYVAWLRLQARRLGDGALAFQTPEWAEVKLDPARRDAHLQRCESLCPEGALTARMGRSILPVLRGEADPVHLMFGMEDVLERHDGTLGHVLNLLRAYLDLYGHREADLRVCEIGAGTGGATATVLQSLCPDGVRAKGASRLLRYTYTDMSAGFFDKAAAKFRPWRSLMDFKVLDVTQDVGEQGFVEDAYDVVVAARVLHATADLAQALVHARSLLRPGGLLLLLEDTNLDSIVAPLSFGQSSGWWLSSEASRPWGPLLSDDRWKELLSANGFEPQVLCVPDNQAVEDVHVYSLFVATKTARAPGASSVEQTMPGDGTGCTRNIIVTSSAPTAEEKALVDALAGQLPVSAGGSTPTVVVPFHDLSQHPLQDTCCIVTLEAQEPFLSSAMTDDSFATLRRLLLTTGGLIWVTADAIEKPDCNLVAGLVRTVRWERDLHDSSLVTLALEDAAVGAAAANAAIVAAVHRRQFVSRLDRNQEYAVRAGRLCINRLVAAPALSDFIRSKFTTPGPVMQSLGEAKASSRAVMLTLPTPGRLDRFRFADWPAYGTPLADDEVEVEVKATGLNFRDVLIAMGELPDTMMGFEGSGIVTQVGARVSEFQPGDAVMFLANDHGIFQTHTRIKSVLVARMPDDMNWVQAAGFCITSHTAYHCLVEMARMRPGETCLVHSAAGGVGQCAIQLAKHLGVTVYATVSSPAKRQLLIDDYGIPAEHIFSSRDLSFASALKRITNGRGVDVVLNSLSGEALRASWDCVAVHGRFLELGKRDIKANGRLDMLPFDRAATFAAVDLRMIYKTGSAERIQRLFAGVIELWNSKVFQPLKPLTVFPYSNVEEAFRVLQEGHHTGKVVLEPGDADVVPICPPPPALGRLRPDVTYLLSGGTGGLGRSIARWMADRGARFLLFLSRSAGASPAVQSLLEEFRAAGVTAHALRCDISDEAAVVSGLDEARRLGMPPIAGVVQCSMELNDSSFELMSREAFQRTLAPKVRGSWNLHHHVPADVDFFVMLSSASGIIGNRGQANYAAANTFQDALAVHRRARGLAASSLDLGAIMGIGWLAENVTTGHSFAPLRMAVNEGIRPEEFLACLEYHVLGHDAGRPAQAVMGCATSGDFAARGMPQPTFMRSPLFAQLRTQSGRGTDGGGDVSGDDGAAVRNGLKAAADADAAAAVVCQALVKRIARVTGIPVADVSPAQPTHAYGIDSLVAIELRNFVSQAMGADVPILDVMSNRSIEVLSQEIVLKSKFCNAGKEQKTPDQVAFQD